MFSPFPNYLVAIIISLLLMAFSDRVISTPLLAKVSSTVFSFTV